MIHRFFISLIASIPWFAVAAPLDTVIFGNDASENAHQLTTELSDRQAGGLGEPARRLLPGGKAPWQGGTVKFRVRVDPAVQNYFTIRLWGEDVNPNQLALLVEGRQVGYRHLGDIEILDSGSEAPAYPGRFYYRTCPLPRGLTQGKESISCEIRATGPIWGYGREFAQYQKAMTAASRGIYRVYTHTDGCFTPPPEEKQGCFPADAPTRNEPGIEVIDAVKKRVNSQINSLLRDADRPCSQMQALFLAKAYRVKWTTAFNNPDCVRKVLRSLDELHARWRKEPQIAQAEASTWNPDWFGLGPCGQIIELMEDQFAALLDAPVDDEKGGSVRRREGWRDMLIHCRDWHREHRRQYTNQSMINDLYGIYLANRGIALLDPPQALPEKKALRYLHEAIGLEPWLGSEKDGKPTRPLGSSFFQLTAKGLTKELGYVGIYGEVIDWVCQIYEATGPAYGRPGDPRIKEQLVKIARARAPFRYPLLDAEGNRAMVLETIIGWRDTHFPGDVTYAQRPSRDGNALEVVAATRDAHLLGHAQQMMADHQAHAAIARQLDEKGFRTTFGLLAVPDCDEVVRALGPSPHRLPMSWDQPDFVFSDEENGVVAIKNGREILYASLYWRARHAVNFLGRVHHLTPEFDRIATVVEAIDFTPSGMNYERRNWTNFGFGNGGVRYPGETISAHAGERLPIAKIPEGIPFKPGDENIHAGRGDFYQLQFGRYRIAMNMNSDKTSKITVPVHGEGVLNLSSHAEVEAGTTIQVTPRTTVVLYLK